MIRRLKSLQPAAAIDETSIKTGDIRSAGLTELIVVSYRFRFDELQDEVSRLDEVDEPLCEYVPENGGGSYDDTDAAAEALCATSLSNDSWKKPAW